MTILIIAVLVGICFWLAYRVDTWQKKYDDACDIAARYSDQRDALQKEYNFLKESVASWNTKPVYALLSDAQIQQIGETVGKFIKEPKWLN